MTPETQQRLLKALELNAKRERDIAQANQAALDKIKLKAAREVASIERWQSFLTELQSAAAAINKHSQPHDILFESAESTPDEHFLRSAEVQLSKPHEERRIVAQFNLDPSGGIGVVFLTPSVTKSDSFDIRSTTVAYLERILVAFFEQYLGDKKT
jgi:hypothetical protein